MTGGSHRAPHDSVAGPIDGILGTPIDGILGTKPDAGWFQNVRADGKMSVTKWVVTVSR